MPANYLEQLVAEWYEYQGYFVRRNVHVGKRAKGGYDCELDVVAFHPKKQHLVHVEPSMDCDSWSQREKRYTKKFEAGRKHIPQLFQGLVTPKAIEQIALLVYASNKTRSTLGGGTLVTAPEFLKTIITELKDVRIESQAVPEHLPIIRTLQFVSRYRPKIWSSKPNCL